jgi:hypothetical protein
MLSTSKQIIAGIPGSYLDPFHLAQSQPERFAGYVVIAYETERPVWDVLILQGRTISATARIDDSARLPVEAGDVQERFTGKGMRERARVFLFEGHPFQLDAFTRTLNLTPVMKIQVDPLSRKQIIRLIRNVPGNRFVAERLITQVPMPQMEFLEIKSPDQEIEFEMRFRRGLLLLYRLDGGGKPGSQIALALDETENPPAEEGGDTSGVERELAHRLNDELAPVVRGKALAILRECERSPAGVFKLAPRIVRASSLLKRLKIRKAALAVVGDFYNKHYEELKAAQLTLSVEECYESLKK